MKKKHITVYQFDSNGNKIKPGKRINAETDENDEVGELISEKSDSNDPRIIVNEWLEVSLANLEKLKSEIILNKYKVHPSVSMYIAGQTEIINYFLHKKEDSSNEAKEKQAKSLKMREEKIERFKDHFINWKKEHNHNSGNASILYYRKSQEVKKWYKKQKETPPSRTTLQGWIK